MVLTSFLKPVLLIQLLVRWYWPLHSQLGWHKYSNLYNLQNKLNDLWYLPVSSNPFSWFSSSYGDIDLFAVSWAGIGTYFVPLNEDHPSLHMAGTPKCPESLLLRVVEGKQTRVCLEYFELPLYSWLANLSCFPLLAVMWMQAALSSNAQQKPPLSLEIS